MNLGIDSSVMVTAYLMAESCEELAAAMVWCVSFGVTRRSVSMSMLVSVSLLKVMAWID